MVVTRVHAQTHTHKKKQCHVQIAKHPTPAIFALMQEALESLSSVHHCGHLSLAPKGLLE